MRKCAIFFLTTILLLLACESRPKYVIPEDEMVDLLVDVHKSEAVIALNHHQYPTDEKKRIVREAVYMRHHTTKADFDSSMVWYGNNLDDYMEIYKRVIDKLNEENNAIKELIKEEEMQVLTQAGDTVDIWKQQRWHIFDSDKDNNILAFSINSDENFNRGDRFSLRFHVVNIPPRGDNVQVYMAIRHQDNVIHYTHINAQRSGWNVLNIQSDSINNLKELYGYIAMPPRNDGYIMYIDSIQLIRMHEKVGMPDYEYKVMDILNARKNDKELPKKKVKVNENKKKKKSSQFIKVEEKL